VVRESEIYDQVFEELIRQESVHCRERASLFLDVRGEYRKMARKVTSEADEALRMVELQKEDRLNLHRQIGAFAQILKTLQSSYRDEVEG
jgi:hypothetical protein